MKKLTFFSIVMLAMFGFGKANAQTTRAELKVAKAASLKEAIESMDYIFKPSAVIDRNSVRRPLLGGYEITVSKDKVHFYMPLITGDGHDQMSPNTGGINHTFTDFDYKVNKAEGKDWAITITTKPVKTIYKLIINPSGAAQFRMDNSIYPNVFDGVVESNSL